MSLLQARFFGRVSIAVLGVPFVPSVVGSVMTNEFVLAPLVVWVAFVAKLYAVPPGVRFIF